MSTPLPAKLERVKRISVSLQRFFKLLFGLNLAALLVVSTYLVVGSPDLGSVHVAGVEFEPDSASAKLRVIAAVAALLRVLISLKATYHLIRLFGLYAAGQIFTPENVSQIRKLGIMLLLLPAVWGASLIAAMPEILSRPGELDAIMPSFPAVALIGGAIVVVVSWIMDVGRELREEHDLVV